MLFVSILGARLKIRRDFLFALFLWHTILCLIYWRLVIANNGDALLYFRYGQEGRMEWAFGTNFVTSVTVLLARDLGLSFLDCMLVFNVIGFVGLLLFAKALLAIIPVHWRTTRRLARAIVFLPGLSYWSAALGKDAIAFCAAGLVVYASADIRKRPRLFVAGMLLMLAIRPHIAILIAMAGTVAVLLDRHVALGRRVAIAAAGGLFLALLFPFVKEYIGLGAVTSVLGLEDAIDIRQNANLLGGGAIDIQQLSFGSQLFAYMFRPLFFDVKNTLGVVASFENAILLGIVAGSVVMLFALIRRQATFFVRFNLLYALSGWGVLAMLTSNLGISVRQKTMFLPSLLALCVAAYVYRTSRHEEHVR